MAWIPELTVDEATGDAAEIFEAVAKVTMGLVPNTIRALSMRPEVMGAVWDLTALVQFGGSGLTRVKENARFTCA